MAQRRVEPQIDARQLGRLLEAGLLVANALGDVFVDRDPSAAGDRGVGDRDHAAVLEPRSSDIAAVVVQFLAETVIGFDLQVLMAKRSAVLDDGSDGGAPINDLGRYTIKLQIFGVPDQELSV